MNIPYLMLVWCVLGTPLAEAGTSFHQRHPMCAEDWSSEVEPRSKLMGRFVPPSIQHVQQSICRCLPKRRKKQPQMVRANLHIEPNKGEVRVVYDITPPWNRPVERMVACLGEPTLKLEPMKYVTDMIGKDGRPIKETLVYPVRIELEPSDD